MRVWVAVQPTWVRPTTPRRNRSLHRCRLPPCAGTSRADDKAQRRVTPSTLRTVDASVVELRGHVNPSKMNTAWAAPGFGGLAAPRPPPPAGVPQFPMAGGGGVPPPFGYGAPYGYRLPGVGVAPGAPPPPYYQPPGGLYPPRPNVPFPVPLPGQQYPQLVGGPQQPQYGPRPGADLGRTQAELAAAAPRAPASLGASAGSNVASAHGGAPTSDSPDAPVNRGKWTNEEVRASESRHDVLRADVQGATEARMCMCVDPVYSTCAVRVG